MSSDVIIQGIGILGCVLGIAAFLSKQDKVLKTLLSLAIFAIATHFFLLGAYAGAASAAVGGVRTFLSMFQRVKPYAPLFFVAYVPLAYLCVHDWIDVLAIIAGLIGTYSMFYLDKVALRYGLFVTSSTWLLHNILQGSIGGTLLELFYLGANIRTIIKLKKEEKKTTTSPQ